MTIQEQWVRILKSLQILAPEIWRSIQPGASEATIRQAGETMGVQFPEEVKVFYRLQNGTADRWPDGTEEI